MTRSAIYDINKKLVSQFSILVFENQNQMPKTQKNGQSFQNEKTEYLNNSGYNVTFMYAFTCK